MYNISNLEEKNRFYNWYNGFTFISLPYWTGWKYDKYLDYIVYTTAPSGMVHTKDFGDTYDPDNIFQKAAFSVVIVPYGIPDLTLKLEIIGLSMSVKKHSEDYLRSIFDDEYEEHFGRNIITKEVKTPIRWPPSLYLDRTVDQKIIENNKRLGTMPGFLFRWSYDKHIDSNFFWESYYGHVDFEYGKVPWLTKEFRRYL